MTSMLTCTPHNLLYCLALDVKYVLYPQTSPCKLDTHGPVLPPASLSLNQTAARELAFPLSLTI